ncbi:HAAS signaling domain-containing protein [Geodermatophilus maliterrae]|uniref:DUF1707 domain-containing protein n=1 Tax=Geodermatophilus maliterrae TaxID=3162531 RepID=A0ABV3XLC6_9ACTN
MTTGTDTYRRELVQALRLRDVAPERIGDIVAEVESHVAETGEDPREAFGPARDYAASVTQPRSRGSWVSFRALIVLSAVCGWLISRGVFGLVRGEPLHGLPAGVVLGIGWLLWVPPVLAQARRNAPVPDPRTGRRLTPGRARVVLVMTVFLAALMALTWLLALLTV